MSETFQRNRTRIITLSVLAVLFFMAIQGMETGDWVITVLRGLSVGAITFLVASGLSLIFGLMDVLNLAHGELFMIGAYVGWTAYVRPDTLIDVLPPILLLATGFVLMPTLRVLVARTGLPAGNARFWPWIALAVAGVILGLTLSRWPLAIWDPEVFAESPGTFSLALDQGRMAIPGAATFQEISPVVAFLGLLLGALALGVALVGFQLNREPVASTRVPWRPVAVAIALIAGGVAVYALNNLLTAYLFIMSSTARFFIAMAVATVTGFILGGFIEVTLIRPLYDRPIYQIMLTLGLSFIGIEVVRTIWGRPEFTMPKAALFTGTGDGCPATSLSDLLAYNCSTIFLFDGRIRAYNEVFIILVGLVVLVAIWLLLQRTRLGMIIRAGVQDSEMVEAMGINVRRVFTLVFALGVALAALGGVLAAPSIGLSNEMGVRLLLLALIALAIGGLTSFPGAAAGAVLVGLLQQFIIKYGQIGINLPFLAEPFKPSPPLVPASTVLLMVIILLVLPNGLFGRNE